MPTPVPPSANMSAIRQKRLPGRSTQLSGYLGHDATGQHDGPMDRRRDNDRGDPSSPRRASSQGLGRGRVLICLSAESPFDGTMRPRSRRLIPGSHSHIGGNASPGETSTSAVRNPSAGGQDRKTSPVRSRTPERRPNRGSQPGHPCRDRPRPLGMASRICGSMTRPSLKRECSGLGVSG